MTRPAQVALDAAITRCLAAHLASTPEPTQRRVHRLLDALGPGWRYWPDDPPLSGERACVTTGRLDLIWLYRLGPERLVLIHRPLGRRVEVPVTEEADLAAVLAALMGGLS